MNESSLLNDTDGGGQDMDTSLLAFRAELARVGEGYLLLIFCLFGIVGNAIAFITFSTKAVRTSTTSVYLRGLAVADILVLVTAVFRYKSYKLFLDDDGEVSSVIHFDPYVEVYVEPLHWIALGSSSFITITLSLERFLAVKYPLFIKRKCTTLIVLVCIFLVVAVVTAVTSPYFASYKVTTFEFAGLQVSVATLTDMGKATLFPCTFHNYVVPIAWYIIPCVFLTVLNILLSAHVRASTKIRVGLPNVSNPNRSLTVLIILIVAVYIICNFPKCAFMFYKLVHQLKDGRECVDETSRMTSEDTRTYLILEVITELLNVLNSCMNFIVYCLVGTRFRRELKKLFMCKKSLHLGTRIRPTVQLSTFTGPQTNAYSSAGTSKRTVLE